MNIDEPKFNNELTKTKISDYFGEDDIKIEDALFTDEIYDNESVKELELRSSKLEKLTLLNCHFNDFAGVDVLFKKCNLSNCDFSGSYFERVEFDNCKLTGVNFPESSFKETKLSECQMDMVNFFKSKMKNILFTECNLNSSDFIESELKEIKFVESDLERLNLSAKFIDKVDISDSYFQNIIFDIGKAKGLKINDFQALQFAKSLGFVME